MAKRKQQTEDAEEQLMKDLWKISGGNSASLEKSLENMRGIPLERCLPLQYVLGVDGLPLHRMYSVVAAWGSTKSAFCDEICARIQRFGGRCYYMDNEKKKNPYQTLAQFRWFLEWTEDMLLKIPGVAEKIPRTYTLLYPDSLDVMLKTLVAYLKVLNEFQINNPDKLLKPSAIVLDSLFSLNNAEAINDIKEGEDINNIANVRNAAAMKTYIQTANTLVYKLPVIVLMVNELAEREQPSIDMGGKRGNPGPSKFRAREVGGKFKDFAYSGNFMLEGLDAGASNPGYILGKTREVPHVRINLKKACFGVQRDEPIVVPYRNINGADEQYGSTTLLWYDWDASLTHLLHKVIGPNKLTGAFDISCSGGDKYTSKTLELHSLSATEFGAAIHANPDVVKFLQDRVFNIQRIPKIVEEPDNTIALPMGRMDTGLWPEQGTETKASAENLVGAPKQEKLETV